jgi:WD40 repeat protein
MNRRRLVNLLAPLFATTYLAASGCGGAARQSAPNVVPTLQKPSAEASLIGKNEQTSLADLMSHLNASIPVTALSWTQDNRLAIGFRDGSAALGTLPHGGLEELRVSPSTAVVQLSPKADLALIATTPITMMRRKNGQREFEDVFALQNVQLYESSAFSMDSTKLYVSGAKGKLRIWGQPELFYARGSEEKLDEYLNRRAPDFFVEFPSLRGPIAVDTKGSVLIGSAQGVVSYWNPLKPRRVVRIMKLKSPLTSLSESDGFVVATAKDERLRVGRIDPPGYLPWSREESALLAAAHPWYPDHFVSLHRDRISARQLSDGNEVWSQPLQRGGQPCGLTISGSGDFVALCLDNIVAVARTSDGSVLGAFAKNNGIVFHAANTPSP